MKIFGAGKKEPLLCETHRARKASPSCAENTPKPFIRRNAGNVFFAIFAAVAMVGAVGYGFNTVLRGPISGMTEVTRRTVAESTIVTSSRLAIVGATTQQDEADCDADGMVEPLPFRDAAGGPAPVNGGYLPTDLVPDSIDPWKTEYGYCAWDSGTSTVTDNIAGCGGNTAKRLVGAPDGRQYSIAIISAGKNKKFETTCHNYDPGSPSATLLTREDRSDDILLGYTYAEANDLGAGMWKAKERDFDGDGSADEVASTRNALEGTGGASFADKVVLQGNLLTGGGLVLPGDPGDNSLTGPCDSANDKQIRRNLSTAPPTLEICNFSGGLGWAPLSGAAGGGGNGGAGGMTGMLVSHWALDETSGTVAEDSVGNNDAALDGAPTWSTKDAVIGNALALTGTQLGTIADDPSLHPTAITVAAWVKLNQTIDGWGYILTKKHGTSDVSYSLNLGYTSGGEPKRASFTILRETGGSVIVLRDPKPMPLGQWTHIAGTFDPSLTEKQMKLYVNGVLVDSRDVADNIAYDTSEALLGGYATHQKDMILDDVRLYNYAISEVEAHNLYNASKPSTMLNKTSDKAGQVIAWGNGPAGILGYLASGTSPSPSNVPNGQDFTQISIGGSTACGIKAGGTVWCWGQGLYGQLGNGASANSTPAVKVKNLTDAVKVSVGSSGTVCAIRRNGEAWCWGNNGSGQLGDGSTTSKNIPSRVSGPSDFVDITSGTNYACGIRSNGEAWCWGANGAGQLGNGSTTDSSVPVMVSNVTGFVSINANAYGNSVCGVTRLGLGYCWGEEFNSNFGNGAAAGNQTTPSQISNITDFIKVKGGYSAGCGLRANGEMWCWGTEAYGELGNGSSTATKTVPDKVVFISDFTDFDMTNITVCGIRKNKELWCWGSDGNGQIGNGAATTADQTSPTYIWSNVIDIAGGANTLAAITDTSVRPLGPPPVQKISASHNATPARCAIDDEGLAWCWGSDANGALGNGSLSVTFHSPTRVSQTGPWTQLAAAGASNCALKTDGTLWCWGAGSNGKLGAGTTSNSVNPQQVVGGAEGNTLWSKASMSENGGCGLTIEGQIRCWGVGTYGRLGNGSTSNSNSPVLVTIDGKSPFWLDVSASSTTTCAIRDDRTAWCWGRDTTGELGNGPTTTANQTSPSMVADPGPWHSISAAGAVTCGIKMDGTAWCWGNGTTGSLGINVVDGTKNFDTPRMVVEPGPWAQISAGTNVTCGVKTDGSGWCWGSSSNGQLGTGGTGNVGYPVMVKGGKDWVEIQGGYIGSCGRKKDGSFWCWGSDNSGILGNGEATSAAQSTPVRVSTIPLRHPWMFAEHRGGIDLLPGLDAIVGTNRFISADGSANTGLGFLGSGHTTFRQNTSANQFSIEAIGTGASAQLSFDAADSTATITIPSGGGGGGSTDPQFHWTMDEGAGTVAADSGPNAANMTTTESWTTGQIGGAFLATGSGGSPTNYAIYASATTFPFYTVSMWINPSSTSNVGIFSNSIVSLGVFSGAAACGINDSTNTSYEIQGTSTLPTNSWTHIACTFGYEAGVYVLSVYVNGVFESSTDVPNAASTETSEASLGMVMEQMASTTFDDIRIYDYAMTPAEVTALYNGSGGGGGGGDQTVTVSLLRKIGVDAATNNFKIARDATGTDAWLNDLYGDIEITPAGDVGIGTAGSPQAKLDVDGAIKIGNDTGGCSGSNSGTIRYDGTIWEYCNGSGWKPFGRFGGETYMSSQRNSIAAGQQYGCGVTTSGYAKCWGWADAGILGDNQKTTNRLTPVTVHDSASDAGWSDWIQIQAAYYSTCGLRDNGTLWCWGTGNGLGNGPGGEYLRPNQVRDSSGNLPGWTDWTQISKKGYSACGLRSNGTAWCWGNGISGQMGNNDTFGSGSPKQVHSDSSATGWTDWVQISSGWSHTCGIRTNGTAWCWGESEHGRLGDNQDTTDRLRPVQVHSDSSATGWTDWVQISAGDRNTCGIRANGTAWCWGFAYYGVLGDNQQAVNRLRPVQVHSDSSATGWTDWVQIDVNSSNACGIRANGTAWCWGLADGGGIGNNTYSTNGSIYELRPAQVHSDISSTGWTDWLRISVGTGSSCGVRANGTMWCWGRADNGQLGNGESTGIQPRPVRVQ